jgi:O-antigen ligase
MLLSLFLLVRRVKLWKVYRLMAVGSLLLGVASVLLSASRGPLVAVVALTPVVIYFGSGKRLSRALVWIVLVALAGLAVIPRLVESFTLSGVQISRYFGSAAAFTESESSVGHASLMLSGWRLFLDHPVLGGGLFEPHLLTYPHNSVIEAFMATGALGGMAFLAISGIAAAKAIALMRRQPAMAWLSILFFQYLIHMQVAGCLYFNPTAFMLMGVMLAVRLPALSRPEINGVGRWRGFPAIPLTNRVDLGSQVSLRGTGNGIAGTRSHPGYQRASMTHLEPRDGSQCAE